MILPLHIVTTGLFVNRFSAEHLNGTFFEHISPTSFYALAARAATDEQASAMVEQWLLNRSRFCIAPSGDFQGNADTCYWGLPSIEASDPAYPPLGYWRGCVTPSQFTSAMRESSLNALLTDLSR